MTFTDSFEASTLIAYVQILAIQLFQSHLFDYFDHNVLECHVELLFCNEHFWNFKDSLQILCDLQLMNCDRDFINIRKKLAKNVQMMPDHGESHKLIEMTTSSC